MIDMYKISFRTLLSAFLLITCLMGCMCACSDDEDPPAPTPIPNTGLLENSITISNITGIPEHITIDLVKAEISGLEWKIITTVEAVYKEGKVTLPLPPEFPAEKLCKVVRNNASDYTGFWPAEETDNAEARVAGLGDIIAYYNNEPVGRIYLADRLNEGSTLNKSFIYYHYTNRPFSLGGYNITKPGQTRKSYQYEASFKKGWNAYVNTKQSNEGIVLCTTSISEETPLAWYFETWFH